MRSFFQSVLALSLFTLLLSSNSSCQKSGSSKPGANQSDGNYGNNPKAPVPDELVGYWLTGTSSITNFWDYNGSYGGNALELAVGYRFFKNGTAKQYFYYTKTTTYCRDQVLGYREGTVVFNSADKTFRFYAASGNYRRFDACGSQQTPGYGVKKQYGQGDLYPGFKAEYNNWTLRTKNGNPVWRITLDGGTFLDYDKSTEPL